MKQSCSETEKTPGRFSKTDFFLCLFLMVLYFAVWGRFGQKFAVGTVISVVTGIFCWFMSIVFRSPAEKGAVVAESFAWSLFALFPLFCPLGLPLWIIPFILIITYLIAVTAFGGFGRHFFNPVVLAVVFMFCGYNATATINATRPLPAADSGYRIWSAGMPPAKPVWRIYETVPFSGLLEASVSGSLPALPGNLFGLPLLTASLVLSFVFGRRRLWWSAASLGVVLFSLVVAKYSIMSISPLHPLLLGIMPGLMLVAVVDYTTLPESPREQVIGGVLFAALAMLFIAKSGNIFGPVFAFLLMQVLLPLLADLTAGWRRT